MADRDGRQQSWCWLQADDTDVETTTIVSKALEQFLAMVVKRTAAVSPSKLTHY
ncbi:hypothetical protein F443_03865 [Phytophthora nicotianae P1569]|uniref:Uncharacterized protein n=1 Tax=Phytophthora nicotianae P1569 TaxID=1317065 RepID=V9FRW7_PHYNI|nr:hypothetical protein F443_03865 [Phytophthora nicotianae P1569]